MIENVTFSDFCDRFKSYGRTDHFTYDGLQALFHHLEEYESATDEQIELDVIALCCDYTQYDNFTDLQANYSNIDLLADYSNIIDMEELQDRTTVIEIPGSESFIIQNF